MASEGRFSKSFQAIQQAVDARGGVLDPNEAVIATLNDLHPDA